MKKSGLFIALLVFSILISSSVYAATLTQSINDMIDSIASAISPISSYLVGDTGGMGNLLFAKTLLLIIITTIVWAVLSQISFFTDRTWVLVIVSLGVGILSVRFLSLSMVAAILLPYSTFGVAVTSGIIFVIFFFLVSVGLKKAVPTVRRIAWILFAVTFIGIWLSASDAGNYRYIYLVTAILALIMSWMDGTIQRFFAQIKVEKTMSPSQYHAYAKLLREYDETTKLLSEAKTSGDNAAVERLDSKLGILHSAMARIAGR